MTRVRCDGDLHLTLEKSDYWNGSLGEVDIDFGPRGRELAAKRFRQHLELYDGKIVIHLADERTGPCLEVWGHPTRRIIVIEVSDPQLMLGPATIRLSRMRGTMTVGRTEATLWAKEIHTAAADVANTGMQGYFDKDNDPLLGRGLGVGLGTGSVAPTSCTSNESTATMVAIFPGCGFAGTLRRCPTATLSSTTIIPVSYSPLGLRSATTTSCTIATAATKSFYATERILSYVASARSFPAL